MLFEQINYRSDYFVSLSLLVPNLTLVMRAFLLFVIFSARLTKGGVDAR